jgi:hypothetical protein
MDRGIYVIEQSHNCSVIDHCSSPATFTSSIDVCGLGLLPTSIASDQCRHAIEYIVAQSLPEPCKA